MPLLKKSQVLPKKVAIYSMSRACWSSCCVPICLLTLNSAFQAFKNSWTLLFFFFLNQNVIPKPHAIQVKVVLVGARVLPVSLHPRTLLPKNSGSTGQRLQGETVPGCFRTRRTRCAACVPISDALVTHCRKTGVERRRVGPALTPEPKSLGGGST